MRRICGAMRVRGCGGGGERALLFRRSRGAACEKVGFGAFFLNWSGGGGGEERRLREVLIRVSCLRDVLPSVPRCSVAGRARIQEKPVRRGRKARFGRAFPEYGRRRHRASAGQPPNRAQRHLPRPSATFRSRRATYRSPSHHLRCNIRTAPRGSGHRRECRLLCRRCHRPGGTAGVNGCA